MFLSFEDFKTQSGVRDVDSKRSVCFVLLFHLQSTLQSLTVLILTNQRAERDQSECTDKMRQTYVRLCYLAQLRVLLYLVDSRVVQRRPRR